MKTVMRAAALSLILCSAAAAPAALAQSATAEAAFRATTLNVSAYGESRVAPDMATISLGVTTEGSTAQAAMQANAARMNQVMAALKKAGFAGRDVQTSQLSVDPQYVYEQNKAPQLNGYRASNIVTLTVRDLSKLGAAVDATVAAGANQMGGINFGLSDPTAAENAAREKAVAALAAKAEVYARATGYRIVRLVSLSEGGGYTPPQPVPMVAMSARYEKADTSVSPGETRVRVDVSAVYELAR